METQRYYFKIYTVNMIFTVYQDLLPKASWDSLYKLIKNHKSFTFFTMNDNPIHINTDMIVAIEISKNAFPERT